MRIKSYKNTNYMDGHFGYAYHTVWTRKSNNVTGDFLLKNLDNL